MILEAFREFNRIERDRAQFRNFCSSSRKFITVLWISQISVNLFLFCPSNVLVAEARWKGFRGVNATVLSRF